jgi:hypothetical protein
MENTPRPAKATRKAGTRPLSVILGTLLIPISALTAFAFVSPDPGPQAVKDIDTQAGVDPASQVVFNPGSATAEDLAAACGPAGLALVDAESAGSISDVQQAALDALREICSQQGIELPGKPLPEPIVQQVIVQTVTTSPPSSSTSSTSPSDDGYEDDDHDDHEDEYEDDEHEDEHESEDEEDDDPEDDD